MPDIPDISSMSPDRWLSKMQTVREELLDEFERIFGATQKLAEAGSQFAELFAEYTVQSETGDSKSLLEVETSESTLIFRHQSGDETVELVPDGEEYWREASDESGEEPEDVDRHHRELAISILQLIPWWAEGAFTRRAGRPGDFID